MQRNLGFTDRLVRGLAGVCLLFAFRQFGPLFATLLAGVGALLIVSAASARCLVYELIGVATCDRRRDPGYPGMPFGSR